MSSEWGPLAALIGDWEGDGGLDSAYSHARESVWQTPYRERVAMKPFGPVRLAAAWNLRRPLEAGRLEALCAGAEVVILRNAFRHRLRTLLTVTGLLVAVLAAAALTTDLLRHREHRSLRLRNHFVRIHGLHEKRSPDQCHQS